ncbi:MAG: hypothetical protein Q4P65_02770 [Eubacteriales bacterium]|nr:hypothetical protein [Eubacteriales bacterium]
MKYVIVNEFPNEFILNHEGVKLSIYQETHLSNPDNEQDPIRFKNLLREARQAEQASKLNDEVWACLEELAKDRDFWNYNSHGLAVFADNSACQIFRLNNKPANSEYVGENFYLLPLFHYFDALDHAYVLGFDRSSFKLLEGNANGLQPVQILSQYATKFKELFPDQDSDSNLNAGSYGGRQASYHGHRAKPEEVEKDKEKFFRHIDHCLSEMLAPHDPIILCALPEHQAEFKKIVKNNKIIEEGIEKPMDALTDVGLKNAVGEILQAARKEHLSRYAERIERAEREENLLSGVEAIKKAMAEARVDTLLISDSLLKETAPKIAGEINELIFGVLDQGGHFFVIPAEYFAHGANYLALLRY